MRGTLTLFIRVLLFIVGGAFVVWIGSDIHIGLGIALGFVVLFALLFFYQMITGIGTVSGGRLKLYNQVPWVNIPLSDVIRLYRAPLPNDPGYTKSMGKAMGAMSGLKMADPDGRPMVVPSGAEAIEMIRRSGLASVWVDVRCGNGLRSYLLSDGGTPASASHRQVNVMKYKQQELLAKLVAVLPTDKVDEAVRQAVDVQ